MMFLGPGSRLQAQHEPQIDSLITQYLELGPGSSWHPSELFDQCLPLSGWRERGFNQFASAELSALQAEGLAFAWGYSLQHCNNPLLERWYFDRVDGLIQRRADATAFWVVLLRADSPRIREYLEATMLNPNLRQEARSEAGTVYFERFEPDERLREYLRAFRTMRMPQYFAWAITERLLREQPERLLHEISSEVRANPGLGDQTAFLTIAQNSHRYASDAARSALAEALKAGLERESGRKTGRHRERLEQAAAQLERSFK